jgi:integrase
MPTQRLTHRSIAKLEAGRWMTDYWDDRLPGFAVRAHQSGTKTYIYRYRAPDGKRRRYTIGRYPALPLADARDIARELAVKIAKGEDPQAVKEAQRSGGVTAETFAELAQAYVKDTRRRKIKSWKSYQAILEKHLLPVWAKRQARSIERRDVIKVIDKVAETRKPSVANLTHAVIGMVFAFGVRQDLVEKNPTLGLKRKYETKGRDRFLSPREIRRVWKALDHENLLQRSIVRMALLTAQRIGEVLSMRWEDLDLEERVWTIPAEVAKNGLAHRVPLTPPALAIIGEMRESANGSIWVFPSPHRGGTRHLAAVSSGVVERLRDHADSHFVIHDLRRTVASHMAALKVPRLTISKVLNHKEAGITKIYDRHSYDAEKREALERWAGRMGEILGGNL